MIRVACHTSPFSSAFRMCFRIAPCTMVRLIGGRLEKEPLLLLRVLRPPTRETPPKNARACFAVVQDPCGLRWGPRDRATCPICRAGGSERSTSHFAGNVGLGVQSDINLTGPTAGHVPLVGHKIHEAGKPLDDWARAPQSTVPRARE